MKRNKIKSGVILILTLAILGACGKKGEEPQVLRRVKVMEIGTENRGKELVFSGVVTPEKESPLGFKIAGNILNIYAEKGKMVRGGDTLAQMDPKDYKVALDAATESYRARVAAAENATLQFKRIEKLYKEKAATKKVYDETKATYLGAIAGKKAAAKEMENAQNRLSYTILRAPYDGYIGNKMVDEGAVVNAGTPIFSMISQGNSDVTLGVSEKEIQILEKASKINFIHGEKSYAMEIKEIGKKPDSSKISYPVTLKFLEPASIVAGAVGKVVIPVEDIAPQIKIPLKAVFENEGTKVWIYNAGVIESRDVVLGELRSDGEVVILEGLNPEDKVITAGVNFLHRGEKVKI